MGRAKAAVLPEPVRAMARTSLPARTWGTQRRCTAVGQWMPRAAHVETAHGERPRLEKDSVEAGSESPWSVMEVLGLGFGARVRVLAGDLLGFFVEKRRKAGGCCTSAAAAGCWWIVSIARVNRV